MKKNEILKNIEYFNKLESKKDIEKLFIYIKNNKQNLRKLTEKSKNKDKIQGVLGAFFLGLTFGGLMLINTTDVDFMELSMIWALKIVFGLVFILSIANLGKTTRQLTQEEYENKKNTEKNINKFVVQTMSESGLLKKSSHGITSTNTSIQHEITDKTLYNSTNLAIEMLKIIAYENSKTIKLNDNDINDFMLSVKNIINKGLNFNQRLDFLKNSNNTVKIGSIKQPVKILNRSQEKGEKKWVKTTINQLCSFSEGINFTGNIVIKNKTYRYFHDSPIESSYSTLFGKINNFFSNKYSVNKNEELLANVLKRNDILGENSIVKVFIESDLFRFIFTNELAFNINYIEIKDGKLIIFYNDSISKLYTFDTNDICYKINNFEQLIQCESEIMTCPIKYDYHERIFQLNKDIQDH